MKKLDLKKQLRHLYAPSARKVETVKVPRLQFVMIDGRIEKGQGPGTSPAFQEATMKRPKNPIDFPVMALEGLWWVEDGAFDISIKDNWLYTLMILLPEVVTAAVFEEARAEVRRKRGESASLGKLQLAHFEEGLCMQVMHIGPYAEEPTTVDRMHAFAIENGFEDLVGLGGKHHEIYMGDPRRAAPAKLKTVLRHPIREAK
jgi:hypothetical protein